MPAFADAFDGQKFGSILADPPWRFSNRTGKVAPEHKRLMRYETMSIEEICDLPPCVQFWVATVNLRSKPRRYPRIGHRRIYRSVLWPQIKLISTYGFPTLYYLGGYRR